MLTNNTILITGGSSGIGLELAQKLIAKHNTVLICGRSQERLDKAQKLLPEVKVFQCDIAFETECHRLYEWVATLYPNCNMLINNAAIVNRILFLQDNKAIEKAHYEFETNILAPIRLSKLFLPLLLKNTNAHLINISTGLVYAPRAVYSFYNATKAALHTFTQTLRLQLSNEKIKVVEVLLPVVNTPWHNGNPPKSAISVNKAVEEMILKLERSNQTEIRIGAVKLLYWLARIAPTFAVNKINSLE